MNAEVLNDKFKMLAKKLLDKKTAGVGYALMTEVGTDNQKLARKAVASLLESQGRNFSEIEICHDLSGAPAVVVYDTEGVRLPFTPVLSLTDECGVSSCLALLGPVEKTDETREIVGVGIDLANIKETSKLLDVSTKRLARCFGRGEIEILKGLPRVIAEAYITEQFAKREAAFKSMSAIYNVYREKNDGRLLPVSFMDFEAFSEGNVIVHGLTSDICKKEGLAIWAEAFHCGGYVGAIAVCMKNGKRYCGRKH